ncbi:hypothetical protein SNE40_021744 [Patella caerulea]|uniref:Uncharacterized protein n=1 Tax=Patella caerulea TaxID=87958 RepID=A0AAN8G8C7_PATCE
MNIPKNRGMNIKKSHGMDIKLAGKMNIKTSDGMKIGQPGDFSQIDNYARMREYLKTKPNSNRQYQRRRRPPIKNEPKPEVDQAVEEEPEVIENESEEVDIISEVVKSEPEKSDIKEIPRFLYSTVGSMRRSYNKFKIGDSMEDW